VPSLHSDGWRIELGIEGKPSSSSTVRSAAGRCGVS
jgi:hypothetical protein